MGRYQKFYSTYIMSRKHQRTSNGTIWERDWGTLGERHKFEIGKRPFYGDSNFVFTDNSMSYNPSKSKSGKWVAHLTYDDITGNAFDVNHVKLETSSDLLYDYAYYGSAMELVRSSVENIISEFPGNVRIGDTAYQWYDSAQGMFVDSGYYTIHNPFDIDFVVINPSFKDYDNELRYLGYSYGEYTIGVPLESSETDECADTMCFEDIKRYVVTGPSNSDYGFDETIVLNGVLYGRIKNSIYRYNRTSGEFVLIGYYNTKDYFCLESCLDQCSFVGDDSSDEPFVCESSGDDEPQPAPSASICMHENDIVYTVEIETSKSCGSDSSKVSTYILRGLYSKAGIVWVSENKNFVIQPKQEIIDEYFGSLSGFEKKLLRKDTKPLFCNTFQTPYENERGFVRMRGVEYTWPSIGYCIDITSTTYVEFLKSMISLGEKYDEYWSDNVYRNMTHESIKNFDWTFSRHYSDGDEIDNVIGGERMSRLLRLYGRFFDDIRMYVDGIKNSDTISYDGYGNTTTAEISDKCELHGWDMYSTIWRPYEYVMMEYDEPVPDTVVKMLKLPSPVDSESPDYVCIACNNECSDDGSDSHESADVESVVCYKKVTTDPNAIYLTCGFVNGNNGETPFIQKYNGWVDETFTGYYYKQSATQVLGYPYDNQNDYDTYPEYCTSETPESIRVVHNGERFYFTKTPVNSATNAAYSHDTWFGALSYEDMTPVNVDIEFVRRLYMSAPEILRSKGTKHSIEMVMGLFGFGENDYECEEYYRYTYPKPIGGMYYFYRPASDDIDYEPGEEDAFVHYSYMPVATATSDDRVEYNGEFFIKDQRDSIEDAIEDANSDKTLQHYYTDIYSGVPLNELILSDNSRYIIPYYNQKRWYDGEFVFQSMGGWGRKNQDGDEYMETMAYLRMVPDIEGMLSTNAMTARNGEICYVSDISGYSGYYQNTNNQVSPFFKLINDVSPYQLSSWENIPVSGPIVYPNYTPPQGSHVTHGDYLRVMYLNSIINVNESNNPHVGYGDYDCGEEFFKYMATPFKYSIDNFSFKTGSGRDLAQSIKFKISDNITDNDKIKLLLDVFEYELLDAAPENVEFDEFNTFTEETFSNMEYSSSSPKYIKVFGAHDEYYYRKTVKPSMENKDVYYLNSKVFVLRNRLDNRYYKGYFMDVILKYLMQVIPSTSILVLDGFDSAVEDADKFHVTLNICKDFEGESGFVLYGDGDYIQCSDVFVRAECPDCYKLTEWVFEDGRRVTTPSFTINSIKKDETLTACFRKCCYDVGLNICPEFEEYYAIYEDYIRPIGFQSYYEGVDASVGFEITTPMVRFSSFTDEYGVEYTDNPLVIENVSNDMTFTACFEEACSITFSFPEGYGAGSVLPFKYSIRKSGSSDLFVQNSSMEEVVLPYDVSQYSETLYFFGDAEIEVKLTFVNQGFHDEWELDYWTVDGEEESRSGGLVINTNGECCGKTICVALKKRKYTLSVYADNPCLGDGETNPVSVIIGSYEETKQASNIVPAQWEIEYGEMAKISTESSDECCRFLQWDYMGVRYTQQQMTIPIRGNVVCSAIFAKKNPVITYTIHADNGISNVSFSVDGMIYSGNDGATGSVNTGNIYCGDNVVFNVSAKECVRYDWGVNESSDIFSGNTFVINNIGSDTYHIDLYAVCDCETIKFQCDKMYVKNDNPSNPNDYVDISVYESLNNYEDTIEYDNWEDYVRFVRTKRMYYEADYVENINPGATIYAPVQYDSIEEYKQEVQAVNWELHVKLDKQNKYYDLTYQQVYNPINPNDYENIMEIGQYTSITDYVADVMSGKESVHRFVFDDVDVDSFYDLICSGAINVQNTNYSDGELNVDCSSLPGDCGCGSLETIEVTPNNCLLKYVGLLDETTGLWVDNYDGCCIQKCGYELVSQGSLCAESASGGSYSYEQTVPVNPNCETSPEHIYTYDVSLQTPEYKCYDLISYPSCNISYLPIDGDMGYIGELIFEKYGIRLEDIPRRSKSDFDNIKFNECVNITEENRFLMVDEGDTERLYQLVVACKSCKYCVECGHTYVPVFVYDMSYERVDAGSVYAPNYTLVKDGENNCYTSIEDYLNDNPYNADSLTNIIIAPNGCDEETDYEYYTLSIPQSCCDRFMYITVKDTEVIDFVNYSANWEYYGQIGDFAVNRCRIPCNVPIDFRVYEHHGDPNPLCENSYLISCMCYDYNSFANCMSGHICTSGCDTIGSVYDANTCTFHIPAGYNDLFFRLDLS